MFVKFICGLLLSKEAYVLVYSKNFSVSLRLKCFLSSIKATMPPPVVK